MSIGPSTVAFLLLWDRKNTTRTNLKVFHTRKAFEAATNTNVEELESFRAHNLCSLLDRTSHLRISRPILDVVGNPEKTSKLLQELLRWCQNITVPEYAVSGPTLPFINVQALRDEHNRITDWGNRSLISSLLKESALSIQSGYPAYSTLALKTCIPLLRDSPSQESTIETLIHIAITNPTVELLSTISTHFKLVKTTPNLVNLHTHYTITLIKFKIDSQSCDLDACLALVDAAELYIIKDNNLSVHDAGVHMRSCELSRIASFEHFGELLRARVCIDMLLLNESHLAVQVHTTEDDKDNALIGNGNRRNREQVLTNYDENYMKSPRFLSRRLRPNAVTEIYNNDDSNTLLIRLKKYWYDTIDCISTADSEFEDNGVLKKTREDLLILNETLNDVKEYKLKLSSR